MSVVYFDDSVGKSDLNNIKQGSVTVGQNTQNSPLDTWLCIRSIPCDGGRIIQIAIEIFGSFYAIRHYDGTSWKSWRSIQTVEI